MTGHPSTQPAPLHRGHRGHREPPRALDAWRFHGGAALLAAVWVVALWPGLALGAGDEGLYVYEGRRVLEGAIPYRDFFFAHPPLRLLLAALGWALGGAAGAKAWAAVGCVAASWLTGAAVRREAGERWGLLAVGLLLTTMLVIRTGTQLLGSNVTMALSAAALLASVAGRFGLAGVALGVGALQALYAVLLLPGAALWAWRLGGRRGLGRLVAGAAVGGVLLGVAALAFGTPFVEQTLLYHLRKVGAEGLAANDEALLAFAVGDVGLLACALAGLLAGGSGLFAAVAGLAGAAVVAAYASPEVYYFAPTLPWLVLAAVLGLRHVARRARDAGSPLAGAAGIAGVLVITWGPHLLHIPEYRAELAAMRGDLDRLASAAPGGPVWGDMALAPYLAVRGAERVGGDEGDTSTKRLLTGLGDPGAVADRALAEATVVVTAAGSGLESFPAVTSRLVARFGAPTAVEFRVLPTVHVWSRR